MVHSTDDRPGWRYHTRVQSFRFFTVILGWALLVGSFYQKPELLTGAQRLLQHFIESIGDTIPSPWGPRIEFIFREIGGMIWLQITLVIMALRAVLCAVAGIWRTIARRDRRMH